MFLHILYTIILAYVTFIVSAEFLTEKKWKNQVAIAMVLLIFILRILHLK